MAHGRFLSKSIATNEQLASVSLEADYLFGRMIPHLDVEGRMPGHPKVVKATAVPMRDELTAERVAGLLGELAVATGSNGQPLVQWYEVGGRQVVAFPAFHTHQRGLKKAREAPSRLPSPDDEGARPVVGTPELVRTNSGPTPDEVRLREGKVREGKVSEGSSAKRPKGEAREGRSTWLSPFIEAWTACTTTRPDERTFGEMARVFKPLVDAHGHNVIVAAWQGYLSETKPDFASIQAFRRKVVLYIERWAVVTNARHDTLGPDDPAGYDPMPPTWPEGWVRAAEALAA